jgi:hypothetical protein
MSVWITYLSKTKALMCALVTRAYIRAFFLAIAAWLVRALQLNTKFRAQQFDTKYRAQQIYKV